MDISNYFTPAVTAIVLVFALASFLLGMVVGRMMRAQSRPNKDSHSSRKRRHGEVVELYIGNLPYEVDDRDLEKIFGEFGELVSVRVIKHRFTGKSKGFGFVEMADRDEAVTAINAMNNKEVKGRRITVNEARSRSR